MKDETPNAKKGGGHGNNRFWEKDGGAESEFTSTFHSIDLPPKEYEYELEHYEAEVRNHIGVE